VAVHDKKQDGVVVRQVRDRERAGIRAANLEEELVTGNEIHSEVLAVLVRERLFRKLLGALEQLHRRRVRIRVADAEAALEFKRLDERIRDRLLRHVLLATQTGRTLRGKTDGERHATGEEVHYRGKCSQALQLVRIARIS
jgi:hypothetical protein